MDLKQIEYILKIAEENNITHAAEKLFITQPALNQQLLKLEKELGTPLFHRSRSNWRLTEAGEIYVRNAKQIIQIKKKEYLRADPGCGQPAEVCYPSALPRAGGVCHLR